MAPSAIAIPIVSRSLVDLSDLVSGEDLWSASYTISGDLPTLDEGITIFFESSLYSNLTGSFGAAASDWDVLLIQPDVDLSAPGFLDVLSLGTVPSFTGPFVVDFTWLGVGDPGVQNFDSYSLVNGFEILGSGPVATNGGASVPDGGSGLVFLVIGLAVIVTVARCAKLTRRPLVPRTAAVIA